MHEDDRSGKSTVGRLAHDGVHARAPPVLGVQVPQDRYAGEAAGVKPRRLLEIAVGRAEARGLDPRDLADGVKRVFELGLQGRGVELGELLVLVGVTHELVAGVDDLLAEIGILLDVLAKVEEGRLATVLLEDTEVLLGVGIGRAVVKRERDELFALVVGFDLVNRDDAVLGLLKDIAVGSLSRGLAVADLMLAHLRPLADIGDVSPGVAAHLELRLLLDDVDVVFLVPVRAVADGDVVAVGGAV